MRGKQKIASPVTNTNIYPHSFPFGSTENGEEYSILVFAVSLPLLAIIALKYRQLSMNV